MKINKAFLYATFILLCVALSVISCSKNEDLPAPNRTTVDMDETLYEYAMVPAEIGKLGRVLFYDKALSINNGVSCGSCHKQALAFSDNQQFSTGFENRMTVRNTPPIQNLMGGSFFGQGQALFWDGRERFLSEMVLQPVGNHIEMGMRSEADLVAKLSASPLYQQLFAEAYNDSEITIDRLKEALAGFVGSMASENSKFERSFFAQANGPTLNPIESLGFNLFVGKYDCMSCHDVISTQGYSEAIGEEFVNIGLDNTYEDNGAGALNGDAAQNGKFKIPNLRNVALTAPYMHDGRFSTLEEVIDHYSQAVAAHPNLDHRLKDEDTGEPLRLNITPDDKMALVAFLHTLTDHTFVSDPKFSDPFAK